jgi:hypothetical protein
VCLVAASLEFIARHRKNSWHAAYDTSSTE